MAQASNVERLLTAVLNDDPISVEDIIPQSNIEHFLKECVDGVDCGHCPAPISRVDILLEALRDKLISGGGSGKTEQEKTVSITQNGTTEVLPDEGKTLSKVTVNTNVQASGGDDRFIQFIEGTMTEITAEDLQGITEIRAFAFCGFPNLTSIIIPPTIINIGSNAFGSNGYSPMLNSVVFEEGRTEINTDRAFTSQISSFVVQLPQSLETIGENAFFCSTVRKGITIANIPKNLKSIGSSAFQSCNFSITEIELPQTLESIGSYAFRYTNLIPTGIKKINQMGAIGTETNKATIVIEAVEPPQLVKAAYQFDSKTLLKIIVPAGCGNTYKAATNWSYWADYIEEAAA